MLFVTYTQIFSSKHVINMTLWSGIKNLFSSPLLWSRHQTYSLAHSWQVLCQGALSIYCLLVWLPYFKGSLSTCICFVWGHTVFRGWTVINVDHSSLQESELWHHDEWSWWLIFCARVCTPAVWTSWFLQILEANKTGQQAWVVGPFQPTRALFGFCNPGWCCWNHLPTSLPLCLHLRTVSA